MPSKFSLVEQRRTGSSYHVHTWQENHIIVLSQPCFDNTDPHVRVGGKPMMLVQHLLCRKEKVPTTTLMPIQCFHPLDIERRHSSNGHKDTRVTYQRRYSQTFVVQMQLRLP